MSLTSSEIALVCKSLNRDLIGAVLIKAISPKNQNRIVLEFKTSCSTDLISAIEQGGKERATQAYLSVRRGANDEANKAIWLRANSYELFWEGKMDQSRRDKERVTINKEFESFDAFIHEYVTNISKSGVFIRSKTPLAIGTPVNLKFTVIMDDIETIEGTGKVVRIENDPPGMGVVFTELTTYSQNLITRLLTR